MNGEGDILEINERDATMRKIGSWKFNISDKKLGNSILSYLIRKYDLNPFSNSLKEDMKEILDLKADW